MRSPQAANSARVHSKRWSRWRKLPAGRSGNLTLYSTFGVVTSIVLGRANWKTARSKALSRPGSKVFDHFHGRGGIEALDAAVAVGEGALQELHAILGRAVGP